MLNIGIILKQSSQRNNFFLPPNLRDLRKRTLFRPYPPHIVHRLIPHTYKQILNIRLQRLRHKHRLLLCFLLLERRCLIPLPIDSHNFPNSAVEILDIFNSAPTNCFDCSIIDRMYLTGWRVGTVFLCSSGPRGVSCARGIILWGSIFLAFLCAYMGVFSCGSAAGRCRACGGRIGREVGGILASEA